jgi:hypothetical protein
MNDKEMQSKWTAYVQAFEQVRQRAGDDQVAMAIVSEVAKDARAAQIRAERQASRATDSNGEASEGATVRQIAYLKTLGVRLPDKLTKQEASALIDEAAR